jgi:mono/diheme cytochrome c family protein
MLRSHPFVLLVFICVVLAGCGKKDESAAGNAPADDGTASAGSGNTLFDQHCAKCHTVSGAAGGPKKKAPDLAKVGADPAHTPDWLAEHIRNPKVHEPNSKMPPFGDRLKPDEVKGLAEFLAAKK